MEIRREVTQAITTKKILEYFQGGESPYSRKKHIKAFKEPKT
jgi:hypothetical protein